MNSLYPHCFSKTSGKTLNTKISELEVDPSAGVFGYSMYASYVFPSEAKEKMQYIWNQKKKNEIW